MPMLVDVPHSLVDEILDNCVEPEIDSVKFVSFKVIRWLRAVQLLLCMLLLLLVGDFLFGDVTILCSLLPGLVSRVILIFSSPLSSAELLNTVLVVTTCPLLLVLVVLLVLLLTVLELFTLLLLILVLLLLFPLLLDVCLPEDF